MKGAAVLYERFARLVLMIFVSQVAFVLHTVAGLIVVGFFPSVAATFSTYRTWFLADDKAWTVRRTWTVFHIAFMAERKAANLFGWPQLLVGMALLWDFYLVNWNHTGLAGIAVSGILLVVNVAYAVWVAMAWAVRSNFTGSWWWTARTSLAYLLSRPLCTVALILVAVVTGFIWSTWPGIAVVFGAVLPIFLTVGTIVIVAKIPGMSRARPQPERPTKAWGVDGARPSSQQLAGARKR